MIKKFTDEFENTFVFIEAEKYIIFYLNGTTESCQFTVKDIVSMPKTLEDALKITKLNIWYSMEDIEATEI